MTPLRVGSIPEGATVEVHLRPRSSRRGVAGVREGALEVRVNAPPVEGRANAAARELLAEVLGISRARIRLATGMKSKRKVFHIEGFTPRELKSKLEEAAKRA